MKKNEILEAYSKLLKDSEGKIDEADMLDFIKKYNLTDWEGDFEQDVIKHEKIKSSISKKYSTQHEYQKLYKEKEKEINRFYNEYQALKREGFSDEQILEKLQEKEFSKIVMEINKDVDSYIEGGEMDADFDALNEASEKTFLARAVKLWDKLFG